MVAYRDTGNIWLNPDGLLIVYPGPRKNYEAYLKDSEVYTLRSKILLSASTASTSLDWDRYNLFVVSVSSSTTFVIDNPRPDSDFVIVLQKDSTGSVYNLTWPASVTWLITPVISLTTVNQEVVLQVSYYNGVFRVGYFTGQVTTLTAPGSAPTGGITGQVLTKNTSTNYDYSWITPTTPNLTNFLDKNNNLSDLISIPTARTNLGLGTAAIKNTGISVGNVVEVQTGGKLPALDGSDLTGIGGSPTGSVIDFAGVSAPSGWLLCSGAAVSRTTYAALFVVVSTTYGVGDGSTTFNLPDLRGRASVGKDNMGGTAANRVTTAGSAVDGLTLGASGGAQNISLTAAQNGPHTHDLNFFNGSGGSGVTGGNLSAGTVTTTSSGTGAAHNNMQPTFILNKIIKT
jgi:microcystin-dependent protein